ncbi:MAG: nitroreductase family protein [Negativicutes bacterium]|nr:nitroreductase family protein [Negativicutes bacterium]
MELLQAIKERRSIRKYRPEPIPDELLETLVKNAMWAPSGMNTQPWKFVVLTGTKKQQFLDVAGKAIEQMDVRLKELFNDKMRSFIHGYFKDLGGAPAVVVVLTAIHEQEVYMQSSYQSSAAAMYNLLLLAHQAGLGTCWMTGQLWVEKEILSFLGYPNWRLLGMTPIGYPDQTPPVPPRKDETIIWMRD